MYLDVAIDNCFCWMIKNNCNNYNYMYVMVEWLKQGLYLYQQQITSIIMLVPSFVMALEFENMLAFFIWYKTKGKVLTPKSKWQIAIVPKCYGGGPLLWEGYRYIRGRGVTIVRHLMRGVMKSPVILHQMPSFYSLFPQFPWSPVLNITNPV